MVVVGMHMAFARRRVTFGAQWGKEVKLSLLLIESCLNEAYRFCNKNISPDFSKVGFFICKIIHCSFQPTPVG